MVPNKTVENLHDRSKPFLLKHFHPANLNVLGKGRKDIFSLEDGVLQKSQVSFALSCTFVVSFERCFVAASKPKAKRKQNLVYWVQGNNNFG